MTPFESGLNGVIWGICEAAMRKRMSLQDKAALKKAVQGVVERHRESGAARLQCGRMARQFILPQILLSDVMA